MSLALNSVSFGNHKYNAPPKTRKETPMLTKALVTGAVVGGGFAAFVYRKPILVFLNKMKNNIKDAINKTAVETGIVNKLKPNLEAKQKAVTKIAELYEKRIPLKKRKQLTMLAQNINDHIAKDADPSLIQKKIKGYKKMVQNCNNQYISSGLKKAFTKHLESMIDEMKLIK